MFHPTLNVQLNSKGQMNRRSMLRRVAGTMTAAGVMQVGWRDLVMAQASELQKQGKAMILLWMDGGPSQFETFNPKPESKYQGPCKPISTNLPGVHIGEDWPETAKVMDKIALIRSMVSVERDHSRAIKHVRSGYKVTPAVAYPSWGSVVSMMQSDETFDLPAYVRVGKPRIATRDLGSGVLGAKHAAFRVDDPEVMPKNVRPTVSDEILARRLSLTNMWDQQFAAQGAVSAVKEKQAIYDRATRFVLSPRLEVFDLTKEKDSLRDAYGRSRFGQGCLLARRLVESGVSFVEVFSAGTINDQGWDTHKNGFNENPILANETDAGYAMLLRDLEQRGMLEDTLVVWMGEFGRTPKFKPDGGREHYSEGWVTCLSGGGVRGGQVIGETDKDGVHVTDRPVGVADLFVSFCHSLGIDPREEYITRGDRPLKLVEGGEVVTELFS
ncbi:DUF1501 domain-containing protein [Planctomycetales bacterium 10988]|nr:DUF1501 domain-containing protein [Planctomycetales bacterium 10988]